MKDSDRFYVEEIHPLVERIALMTKQNGIPMFMTFQTENDSFRTTCFNDKLSEFDKFKHYRLVNEAWSIDELLGMVIDDARKNGHNSSYLKAMGIPMSPE